MLKKIEWLPFFLGIFNIAFFSLPFFGIEKNIITFAIFICGIIYGSAFICKAIIDEKAGGEK